MKKIIILLLAAIICSAFSEVSAQSGIAAKMFKDQGKSNLYLGTEKTAIAEGDINQDGIKDLVIAEIDNPFGGVMAVYWGTSDGYKLYSVFKTKNEVSVSITTKGVLRIQTNYKELYSQSYDDADCITFTTNVYLLRWQDYGLYLIGGKTIHADCGDDFAYGASFNPLTNKVITLCQDAENGKDFPEDSKTFTLPAHDLLMLAEISIGEYHFEDYGYNWQSNPTAETFK